jgi:hypothetical protein
MANLPEPSWGADAQKTFEPNSSLCSTGIRPSYVTGILVQLLRAHFYDVNNIQETKLKGYLWDSDITKSHIEIEPGYKYKAPTVENMPALYVAKGPMQILEFALDNRAIPHVETNGNFMGVDRYVTFGGVHEIHCCGQEAHETELLAEEVFLRLLEYYPSIKEDLNFSDFKVVLLGELSKKPTGSGEHYVNSIKVDWKFVHGWTLVAIAPILKKAGFEIAPAT